MKSLLIIFLLLHTASFSQPNPLLLQGKIGDYQIEVEITDRDYITGELKGKYHYAGKTAHLDLSGVTYNTCLILDESYEGENTGTFYLSFIENKLEGKWFNDSGWHNVELEYASGDWDMLFWKSLDAFNMEVNNDLSGVYGDETYFINYMWFSEDNPQMELGFNGGYIVLDHVHPDSLRFGAELICGPTYHFAIASGIAVKTDSCFLYKNEDGCEIEIHPDTANKSVFIKANNSLDCGFGARAHMHHDLVKVSDDIPEEEEPSLNKILGRETQRK